MAFPAVQAKKLAELKAMDTPAPAVSKPPAPSAVASMTPGPTPAASSPDAPTLDLAQFAVDPPEGEAPVPAAPTPNPASASNVVELEELQRDRDAYKKRWESGHGIQKKLELEVDELKLRNENLEKQIKDRLIERQTPTVVKEVNAEEGVSPEDLKVYKDALPVVKQIATNVAKSLFGEFHAQISELRQQIEQLTKENKTIVADTKQSSERQFYSRVQSAVKDFDKIVASSEWRTYLENRIQNTPYTIGQMLRSAHEAEDFDRVVEIFKGFTPREVPNLSALETPRVSGATSAPVNPDVTNKKPMLKWSARKKASENYRKGRITREELDQIDRTYNEAMAENRIDYKQ